MPKPKRNPQLEQRWRNLLDQWRNSNQTVSAFCQDHGVSEASFYSWRAELARRDQKSASATNTPTFVPVQVLAHAPLEVVLPSGVVIRVPLGTDLQLVVQLVAALGTKRC
jgi:transposase-like protein